MAEPDGLTAPASAPDPPGPGRDRTVRPLFAALAGLALLGLALGFAPGPGPVVGRRVHLVLEVAATTLALVVGALALVRYASRRRWRSLAVGAAFAAVGILDGLQASALLLQDATLPDAMARILGWSWFSSRLLLSAGLFFTVPDLWFGHGRGVPRGPGRDWMLFAAMGGAVVVALAGSVALPPPVHGSGMAPHVLDLVPGVLFALAAWRYLRRPGWADDVFDRGMVHALFLGAAAHLAFAVWVRGPWDLLLTGAHLFKLLSYVAVLVGVLLDVHLTFRREERSLAAVRGMNKTLAREVATRREAEAVLQRSEERLQNFLDSAHDLIQSTDPQGRLLYVNPAWERTLGYVADEAVGRPLAEVVHPGRRTVVAERLGEILAGAEIPDLEIDFLTRDGERVVCSGSGTRHVENGEVVSVQAILRDVSGQRLAERELAESRASLAAVVESTGDGIWSVDGDMRLVTFNTAFALALEARSGREARVGAGPEEVFDPEDAAWHRALYERALRGERFSELRREAVAGQERLFEVFCNPITGDAGISGAVMFGKDVTRRARAEEALRVAKEEAEGANRAKSQFLANMSHELRTPLNSVIGFTNVLLKNKQGNLTVKEMGFLERVLANGRHLLSLINEVLDLAKIEAGRMELDITEVDPAELVSGTVAQLEGQARERSVALAWEGPDDLPPLETDEAKLRQVLINLVGNALKFSGGGAVTVRLLERDGGLDGIAVEDTGIGIPPERLEAIFEAFQQADGSTAREYGGTGLGLAISRSICQLLGYDLEVRSVVGEGSTFTIRTAGAVRPRRPGEAAPHPADDDPTGLGPDPEEVPGYTAGAAADLKVLVVDDEPDSRILMAHYLRDFGCRVFTAPSAEEGIELARAERPDLITLDLVMPGMSGWEALHRLKDDPETRRIPVVVVSIVAEESRGRLLGAVDLLTKPLEREDLLRVLWRHRGHRQGGRVLVVVADRDERTALADDLIARGLEVATAGNGREAMRMVEEDAPDVVVTELTLPIMDGTTFLTRLRQNRYYTGLPAVVLSDRDLTRSEEVVLQEKAHAILRAGPEQARELHRTLSWILPLESDGGS